MEKDLIKFMDNIKYINKDMAKYEDQKGNLYTIPNGQLICNCVYMELTESDYKKALFNKTIDKLDYKETDITVQVSKETITKKEKDRYTLVDKKEKAKQVWLVTNGLKVSKSFSDKLDAVKLTNKINDEILKQAEIV